MIPPAELQRDPDELLERLVRLHRTASVRGRFERLELYHRSSIGIRVDLDTNSKHCSLRLGSDDGIAVRVQAARSGEVRFAATTGADQNVVDWALAEALGGVGSAVPGRDRWLPARAVRLRDNDAPALPAPETVESWLQRAWRGLCRTTSGPAAWTEGSGRAEVARTIESWVSDTGLRASRSRTRAWAVAQTRRCETTPILRRPLFAASRTWEGLDGERWAELWSARGRASRSQATPPRDRPLLLTPEASAELVATLARALHGPGNPIGGRVGPGWILVDDPLEDGALHGGLFDDSGFPTARRALADGERVVGVIDGPGHLRRASFRDPPAPLPSRLRVETAPAVPPTCAVRVSSIVLHAHGSSDWTVEVAGPAFRPGFFRLPPRDLAKRCVAASGERQTDHRGIATPSLLLENVDIRPLDG